MTLGNCVRLVMPVGLLTVLHTLGLGPLPIFADSHCQVQLGRGWTGNAGKGTIVMKNIGKPCEGTLYTIPDQGVVVDAIKVVSEPKSGTISIKIPKFFYTANAGFSGRDRFELSAEGPDREKGERIKLKGEVTVQVNPP